jgi:hypothetical protein
MATAAANVVFDAHRTGTGPPRMVQCATWLGCPAFPGCMAGCLLRESRLCLDQAPSDSSQPEIPAHGLPAECPLVSTDDVKACSSMIFR